MIVETKMIERAAELWARKLGSPAFDNGDNSLTGDITQVFMDEIARRKLKAIDLETAIPIFKKALIEDITDKMNNYKTPIGWGFLNCDYQPDQILSVALDAAGIPYELVSIKSSVHISRNYVQATWGYGAAAEYHYPLPDNGWFITSLNGDWKDIKHLVKCQIDQKPTSFEIEDQTTLKPASLSTFVV